MIWVTDGHTIQNAHKAGLGLCEPDDAGTPEWLGDKKAFEIFRYLEDEYDRI